MRPYQRGEYGSARIAQASARVGLVREASGWTTSMNLSVIGVGLLMGLVAWPRYAKDKPLGVIALGASGSLVSAGIVGLMVGTQPSGSS